jgi:hypothetical protein
MPMPDKGRWHVANTPARQYETEKHVEILATSTRGARSQQRIEISNPGQGATADREVGTGPKDPGTEGVQPRRIAVNSEIEAPRVESFAPRVSGIEVTLRTSIERNRGDQPSHAHRLWIGRKTGSNRRWPARINEGIVVSEGCNVVLGLGQAMIARPGQAGTCLACVSNPWIILSHGYHHLACRVSGRSVIYDDDLNWVIGNLL